MQYYIVVSGQQVGPLSFEELRLQNLTPESLVWREGLTEWVTASTLPELSPLFIVTPPPSESQVYPEQPVAPAYPEQPTYPQQTAAPQYGAPQQPQYGAPQQPQYTAPQQPQYGAPQGYPPYNQYGQPLQPFGPMNEIPHTNYMPWAIILTILCSCSCVGLVLGIISIVNANKANDFYRMGNAVAGESANKTAKTLIIINAVLLILSIIGYIIYFAALGTAIGAAGFYG